MSKPLDLRSELPWLAPAQERLRLAHVGARLGSGLLIQGSPGIGAAWLARWLAALMLCEQRTDAPCAECRSCKQVEANQHPDFYWLEPIEESREIRVGQVRELLNDLALTPHGSGWKVVVLSPADRLNRNAANAMLKTLEEPTARTALILVAAQPSRLPATLRSRCQRIELQAPDARVATEWLIAQEVPVPNQRLLQALALEPLQAREIDAAAVLQSVEDTVAGLSDALAGSLDVVATAERWSRSDYEWRLRCIETWLTDRLRQSVNIASASANLRAAAHLPAPLPALNIRALFELLDAVRELRRMVDAPLNKSLGLERILWRIPAATSRSVAGW